MRPPARLTIAAAPARAAASFGPGGLPLVDPPLPVALGSRDVAVGVNDGQRRMDILEVEPTMIAQVRAPAAAPRACGSAASSASCRPRSETSSGRRLATVAHRRFGQRRRAARSALGDREARRPRSDSGRLASSRVLGGGRESPRAGRHRSRARHQRLVIALATTSRRGWTPSAPHRRLALPAAPARNPISRLRIRPGVETRDACRAAEASKGAGPGWSTPR